MIIKSFKIVISLIKVKVNLVNGFKIKYCKFLIKRRINLILMLLWTKEIMFCLIWFYWLCVKLINQKLLTQIVFKELKSGCGVCWFEIFFNTSIQLAVVHWPKNKRSVIKFKCLKEKYIACRLAKSIISLRLVNSCGGGKARRVRSSSLQIFA